MTTKSSKSTALAPKATLPTQKAAVAAWLLPAKDLPAFEHFGVSRLLAEQQLARPNLQSAFDLTTPEGIWAGNAWLYARGLGELGLEKKLDRATLRALNAIPPFWPPTSVPGAMPAVNWMMFLVWRASPDLIANFDLRDPVARQRYALWFVTIGFSVFSIGEQLGEAWRQWLTAMIEPTPGVRLPRVAVLLQRIRPDLASRFKLDSLNGCRHFAGWLKTAGKIEPALRWLAK